MPIVRMPDGVEVSFPDSMPDDQIRGFITQKFPDAAKSKGVLGYVDDAVRSIASGITFGYADELAAKGNELFGSGNYAENLKKERARDAAIPGAISVPGEVAGAIGSTLLAAPAVGGAAAAAGLARLPAFARFGALGAAEGGLAGAGNAVEGERLGGAGVGAAIGAPVGAAAPTVVRGAASLFGGLRNAVSPQANVSADLSRAITRDVDNPADLLARFNDASIERPGVATLGDVGGENVRGLVERVAQTPGAGRTQVVPALTQRQQQQAGRISNDLRTLTGTNRTAVQAVEETMAERATAARPLYDEAMNFNAREVPDIVRAWQEVTATGWGQQILRSADMRRTLQTEYGIRDIQDAPLMVLVDAWKKQVDGVVGEAVRGGNNNRARVLGDMRDRLVGVVDQHNDAYAAARNAWAGPSQYLDAIERGRGILSRNEAAEEFVARFRGLGAADQEAERIGAVSSIISRMGNDSARLGDMTKYLRSPEVRAKVAAIMPTQEAQASWARRLDFEVGSSELTGRALGNSATARRLAEREDAQGLAGDLVMDALTGTPQSMIRRVIGAGPRWLRDTMRSRADALLADVLTNPQAAGALANRLRITVNPAQPSNLTNAAATATGVELTAP